MSEPTVSDVTALIERVISAKVAEAIKYRDKEWADSIREDVHVSYGLTEPAPRALTIQVAYEDDILSEVTLLDLLDSEINFVKQEDPSHADKWIAALEQVISAFRAAQKEAE